MNKSELLEILERNDIHPSRKLGQNFLIDPNMLSALMQDAAVEKGQRILEIGPGLGMLTGALLDSECDVTAVELDHRLAEFIRQKYGSRPKFRLIQGDAVKQDYDVLMGTERYRCVANLPYSCSTPFLSNIASAANPPTDLCVLLQKEMADRLVAAHGTKDYGLPTVKIALRYRARILRTVPPNVFFPPPEITSAFVRLEYFDRCGEENLRCAVEKVATAAFSQRRKKSSTMVAQLYPGKNVEAAYAQAGLSSDMRADAISIPAYIALTKALEAL